MDLVSLLVFGIFFDCLFPLLLIWAVLSGAGSESQISIPFRAILPGADDPVFFAIRVHSAYTNR